MHDLDAVECVRMSRSRLCKSPAAVRTKNMTHTHRRRVQGGPLIDLYGVHGLACAISRLIKHWTACNCMCMIMLNRTRTYQTHISHFHMIYRRNYDMLIVHRHLLFATKWFSDRVGFRFRPWHRRTAAIAQHEMSVHMFQNWRNRFQNVFQIQASTHSAVNKHHLYAFWYPSLRMQMYEHSNFVILS